MRWATFLSGSIAAVVLMICLPTGRAFAQFGGGFGSSAVGGVSINPDGVVSAPTIEDQRALEKVRQQVLTQAPTALQAFTELRAVSLKQLEATLAKHREQSLPIPDDVKFLAGLQRVQYVLIYPERNDIVLAGPAEGWDLDALGNVVGATTRRPVLLLEDLIIALRTRQTSRLEAISCSIDPTPEGVQRLRALASRLRTIGNPRTTMQRLEEALGPQVVSVSGVPATSHFARSMVAADFRMKRLAMNFQPAPVDNMPSFLHLVKASGRGMQDMMPRWWLAPKYEPLARDADGLAWQLRGQGVECLTEQDYFNSDGLREHSGKASPAAARWARTLTERYAELADHDSAFAELRNVMDLAVVAALIDKEQLLQRAGLELPLLLNEETSERYPAPRRVASQASFIQRGRNWVISTSGGVQLLPWEVADRTELSDAVDTVRQQFSAGTDAWWWE